MAGGWRGGEAAACDRYSRWCNAETIGSLVILTGMVKAEASVIETELLAADEP